MEFLNTINDRIVASFGPMGPLMAVGLLGVILIVLTIASAMPGSRKDPMERLRSEQNRRRGETGPAGLRSQPNRRDRLQKYATFLEPQSAEEMSSARLKMLQAGFRDKGAVRTMHAAQLGLALGLMLLGLMYVLTKSGNASAAHTAMWVLGPALVGYYAPRRYVEKRREARQEQITQGFPDALDMLLVCIEAGQSFDQAILRVARELRAGYPALAEEFEMVSQELKAGKERVAVFKDMSERCGVTDVSSFVTVLVQSASFGTSIADALRVYAAEMRDKRVMRAEEKANTLPTKLTLGTMMFTVPPLMIILIGPSVHGIIENFANR